MSNWIFRANPERFRIHDYLREYGHVEYLQREKVEEGDIIYLYITGKVKRVEYKMVVERANIPFKRQKTTVLIRSGIPMRLF